MTRTPIRNYSLSVVVLFIAVLTQTMGAGQRFTKDAVLSARQSAGVPGQLLSRSPLPEASNPARIPVVSSQRDAPDVSPTGPVPLIFLPVVIYSSGRIEIL